MSYKTPSLISAIYKLNSLLSKSDKLKLSMMAFAAVVGSIFELITATVIMVFAQVIIQPDLGISVISKIGFEADIQPNSAIIYIAIIVGICFLSKNLFASAEVFAQNFTIQKMNFHFKNRLLEKYAKIDYALSLTRNSSFGIQAVAGDTEQLFSNGMVAIVSIFSEVIVFIALTCMIIYVNPSLAFYVFGISALISVFIIRVLLPKFYIFGKDLQNSSLNGTKNLIQFFHAFKEVVLNDKKEYFISKYNEFSLSKSKIQALQTSINTLPRLVIEILFIGLFVVAVIILCLENQGSANIVSVLSGYLYAGFRLMPSLNRIINNLSNFKYITPSIERLLQEINLEEQLSEFSEEEIDFKNNIKLKEVSFKYPNAKKTAIKKLNLEIKKGEKIGIIGCTGSGKSTLVDLILGLLKPSQGSILVDEKFLVRSKSWHKLIGYVPQSTYLIDDSIKKNIAFGEDDIIEYRLQKAVIDAQLGDFLKNLENGVETIVGERGILLSGGERQRISIARALYKDPEILIFDEATSALDNKTESKLMKTINAISRNRTVIMIAHRLTTLKNCDRIVVIDNGVIKKITNYQEIIQANYE